MRLATIRSKEENDQFVKVAADAGEHDIIHLYLTEPEFWPVWI